MPSIVQQLPPVPPVTKSRNSAATAKSKGAAAAAADFEKTLANVRAPAKKEEEPKPRAKEQTSAEKKASSTKPARARKPDGQSAEKPADADAKPQPEAEAKAPTEDPSTDNAQPQEGAKPATKDDAATAAKQCVAQAAQDAANIALQAAPLPVDSKPAPETTSAKSDTPATPINNDAARIAKPTIKPLDHDIPQAGSAEDKTIPNAAKSVTSDSPTETKPAPPADNANADASAFEQVLKKLEASDQTDKPNQPVAPAASQLQPSSVNLPEHAPQTNAAPVVHAPPPAPPEIQFADANHPKIVTAVRTELLPNGGSMRIRLDPPSLGEIQVQVDMRDGVMTASFQTSSDEATRLLTHSLGQLKQSLESQGVSVEKLQVQQAPREQFHSNTGDEGSQQRHAQDNPSQQEQQRREMLQRMWRRLRVGSDPLDLVA
jgi:flagellar hook-length control protein FliK